MRTIQIFDLLFHRVELIYYYTENIRLIFFVNYSFQYIYWIYIFESLYYQFDHSESLVETYLYIIIFFFLKIKYLLIAVLSINLLSKSY